jgi:hypothetical protein
LPSATNRAGAAVALAAAALGACGSQASETSLEKHLGLAVAQIRDMRDYRRLHSTLERTLAAVRAARPTSATERRAKPLVVGGLRWWLRGLESQIAFVENDSGNLPIATRDAARAYHAQRRGAKLLRRAGELLGLRIRMLSGL